jgi:NitT/TauT family transport system permease protein
LEKNKTSIWGNAIAALDRVQRFGWADLVIVCGLAGLFYGLFDVSHEWVGEHRPTVDIDLSPWALPLYTFYSLCRGLLAYVISLVFTLLYGYWAAKDHIAERVLIPLLDILQSIPVLGFLPGLVLALVALFPKSNIGLELAAVLMIFTGQVWNMTFSFYHSLRSVPESMRETASVYRFTWWQTFSRVELPFATMGLVWNSMMSMAGGWFFLMINEAFQLGDRDFRLPGIGSYMSVAVEKGDSWAMVYAIMAMTLMIVALDQLLWRPVVVWAQKFRVEEGGAQEAMNSWFLQLLRKSHLIDWVGQLFHRIIRTKPNAGPKIMPEKSPSSISWLPRTVSMVFFVLLLVSLAWGAWSLLGILTTVTWSTWLELLAAAGITLGRVLLATFLGLLWTLPAGLAIGLSPKLSRILQPVIQVVASFPAPMLFPIVIAAVQMMGIPIGVGSTLLMILGTQWYILFNVIAGAMAIPADLKEAARSYRMTRVQRFWRLYLPAVFPYLVTGLVTAAGGAWNASIVAEYVTYKGTVQEAWGLGATISAAAAKANFPVLAASVLIMSALVVTFNRLVWRRLYRLAEDRYSLNK